MKNLAFLNGVCVLAVLLFSPHAHATFVGSNLIALEPHAYVHATTTAEVSRSSVLQGYFRIITTSKIKQGTTTEGSGSNTCSTSGLTTWSTCTAFSTSGAPTQGCTYCSDGTGKYVNTDGSSLTKSYLKKCETAPNTDGEI